MRAKGSLLISYFIILTALALSAASCGKGRAGRSGAGAASPGTAAAMPMSAEERKLPPLPVRELSPELRRARERAAADASRLRGLGWMSEVGIRPLTSFEFGARASEVAGRVGGEDLRALSRLAVAGGILPEGTDLAALAASFTSMSAGAVYSPPDGHVLLLSDDAKGGAPKSHSLLTHEFVHALQDQHFNLMGMLLSRPYNFDRTEAVFALVEGDATNVQRRLEAGEAYGRRTLDEIARAEDGRFDSYRRNVGWLFPPLVTETFIFRYRDGARFVETMRRARPAVSADELFRRPPASTEQLLHPEKYLSQEAPREVSLDGASFTNEGWRLTASTTLGEVGARGLLLAGVAQAESRRAAAGWGGDRAYAFEREGHGPLFVWKTAWDTAADAAEFFAAYNKLKSANSSGEVAASQAIWREGDAATLVRLEGDMVLVVRGAAGDIHRAAEAALR